MSKIKALIYNSIGMLTMGKGVNRKINEYNIRFPARWSRYYTKDYEPRTFDFFRSNCQSGDTVLDIGAHIGLFSVVFAKIVGDNGKVFSFEPTPFTRQVLNEVISLNELNKIVEIRDEAISDKRGKTTFYDTGDSEISNANSLVKTERSHHGIEVELTTVDAFVSEKQIAPDFLKIDVEGAELDLLRGAAKTFTENRPKTHLSLHPSAIMENKQSLADIWDLVESYGMQMFYEDELIDKKWFCKQEDLFDVCLFPANKI